MVLLRASVTITWQRVVALLAVAAVLGTLVAWWSSGGQPDGSPERDLPVPGVVDFRAEQGFLISYATAAHRLEGLDAAEADDQIRDWARVGLAARLKLNTAQLRDATYDTLPIRDPGLDGLVQQPSGPGRALYGPQGVLHVLVPRRDPHRARTIGLLLDQARTDAGADPPRVQVHEYRILRAARAIAVWSAAPAKTAAVRQAGGYVVARVDDADELADFLRRTTHLSTMRRSGGHLWAEGWHWGGPAPVSAHDLTVLQRGYDASSGPTPGFSLDPGVRPTAADLRAIVPRLDPQLADAIAAGTPQARDLIAGIQTTLFSPNPPPPPAGLPHDRTRLWALLGALTGAHAYSVARYDGPLAGTEVGMTLFYTDLTAKNWVNGVGGGVPSGKVPGFVPDPLARTPLGHCPAGESPPAESGRLWFGQADNGIRFGADRVDLGAQATRLFIKADGAGGEVDASYSFGRGLRWWDRHYRQVADYDPQFARLDQLMRWASVLEWLTATSDLRLPDSGAQAEPDEADEQAQTFADWYARHDELRERAPIEFVAPPSANQEAVLTQPSKTYDDCGFREIRGGVSLADLYGRAGERPEPSGLSPEQKRAGVYESSAVDPEAGAGSLRSVSLDGAGKTEGFVERRFETTPAGERVVKTTGSPRKETSLGGLKVVRAGPKALRHLKNTISAGAGHLANRLEYQGNPLGTLSATTHENGSISVTYRRGPVDKAIRVLRSIEDSWSRGTDVKGVLHYRSPDGQVHYPLGGPSDPFLTVSSDALAADAKFGFRTARPNAHGGVAEYRVAEARGPPDFHGAEAFAMTRNGQLLPLTQFDSADPSLTAVPVRILGGAKRTVYLADNRYVLPAGERLGALEFALLQRFPALIEARGQARGDVTTGHYYRGIPLADGLGVALVGRNDIVVLPATHPLADKASRAIGSPRGTAFFSLEGNTLKHVAFAELEIDGSPATMPARQMLKEANDKRVVYVADDSVPAIATSPAQLVAENIRGGVDVVVTQGTVRPSEVGAAQVHRPDLIVHDGEVWHRVATETDGGLPFGPGAANVDLPVYLVCTNTATQPGGTTETAESTQPAEPQQECAA